MTPKDRLLALCVAEMKRRGVYQETQYQARIRSELRAVEAHDEYEHFLSLHDSGTKFPFNENNLLLAWLLGLADDYDIGKPAAFVYGESPDVDVDYIPEVADYLKNDWAKREFGRDNVCAIGNYATFGIRSALIDMARVFGKDNKEILSLTTKLSPKDEEGKILSWDKAMELFPDLREYCERNPDVADAAKHLLNRNRGMGKHAGGLIISKSRLDDLVPLVRGKDDAGDTYVSAFVEGMHGTDLGPLGLIKYDLLVVRDLLRIAEASKLVKTRHGLAALSALPGQDDWSDLAYLDDPKCMAMAKKADLRGVFQFDSEGIRRLCAQSGVNSFDDLVAVVSLFRPGPMQCVRRGTMVATPTGSKPIEDLRGGEDEVCFYDGRGATSSTKKFTPLRSGRKKILRIRTKSGRVIHASPDHRLLTAPGVFREAGELRPGDRVATVAPE